MTALVSDALGPRARRRVLIATVVSGLLVAVGVVLMVRRLADKGQLDAERWRPLAQWSVVRFLLGGLWATVRAALVAMALAVVLGGLLALARLSRTAAVRWAATAWIEFFRGVPLLLLILFSALALPHYGIDLSVFWYLVLGLVAYNSAVLAEIFRAGINSLDRGQREAADAIGLRYWQAMRIVIVPQAARRMLPAIVSQLVTLLKDTSLGYVIAYEELLRRGRSTGEYFKNPLQTLVVVAVVYMLVNLALSLIARRLERRRPGTMAIVTGVEDLAVLGAGPP